MMMIVLLEDMYYNVDMDDIPKYTKIVGVSFYDRQQIINSLKINQMLELKRDYNNKYDKNAIGVYDKNKLVGWISKQLSEKLAPEIDNGLCWEAIIKQITGNDKDMKGVNIELIFVDK